MAKVNKQLGFDNCGVFAAAYFTSVAFGYDPTSVVYNQECLRQHLLSCLENKKMTRAAFTYISVQVYCDC